MKVIKKLTTADQKLTTAGQISQNWKIKISREFGLVFSENLTRKIRKFCQSTFFSFEVHQKVDNCCSKVEHCRSNLTKMENKNFARVWPCFYLKI